MEHVLMLLPDRHPELPGLSHLRLLTCPSYSYISVFPRAPPARVTPLLVSPSTCACHCRHVLVLMTAGVGHRGAPSVEGAQHDLCHA